MMDLYIHLVVLSPSYHLRTHLKRVAIVAGQVSKMVHVGRYLPGQGWIVESQVWRVPRQEADRLYDPPYDALSVSNQGMSQKNKSIHEWKKEEAVDAVYYGDYELELHPFLNPLTNTKLQQK